MQRVATVIVAAICCLFFAVWVEAQPVTPVGLRSVSHDTSLSGSGTAASNLGVNFTNVQKRIGSSCTAGSSIRAIDSLGSVTCETDDGYTSGALDVTGDFAVNTNKFNVTASSGDTTIAGTLGVTGAITENSVAVLSGAISANTIPLGSSGNLADSAITDNGTTIAFGGRKLSNTYTGTGTVATITDTASGLTSNLTLTDFNSSATFDTTAGGLQILGQAITMTGSRSAGGNSLTQYAALYSASGAQVNVAMRTNSGENWLNVSSGNTYVGYGASAGPSTQRLGVLSSASSTGIGVANTSTAQGSHTGILSSLSGTVDATGGNRTATGVSSSVTASRSAGANNVTNKAGLFTASGGQVNIALETTDGNSYLAATSGNVSIGVASAGTQSAKLHVSGDVLATSGFRCGSSSGPTITSGTGSPESAVTAPVGSLFLRTDGGAGTSLYVKESGAGNTGWVGK